MTEPELPINQMYFAFQWEGEAMGSYALFIRLQGCPINCIHCPTPFACDFGNEVTVDEVLRKGPPQDPDSRYAVLRVSHLMALIKDAQPAPFDVVVTGGEPAMHDLLTFSVALQEAGYDLTVQTTGEVPFHVMDGTRISVRPRSRQVIPEILNAADELIFIVRDAGDLAKLDTLMEHVDDTETAVFLQPVLNNLRAMQFCMNVAPERGFRLSYRPDQLIK